MTTLACMEYKKMTEGSIMLLMDDTLLASRISVLQGYIRDEHMREETLIELLTEYEYMRICRVRGAHMERAEIDALEVAERPRVLAALASLVQDGILLRHSYRKNCISGYKGCYYTLTRHGATQLSPSSLSVL